MKRCYKCKLKKPESEFFKDRTHKDGLNSKCKVCQMKYFTEYRLKNKEKISKYQADWYRRKHETP